MSKESTVFFPEEMQHVQLVVPYESAGATIKLLADKDLIHLVDKNTGNDSVNKRYTESYIRCEEAERCLNFIGSQLETYDLLPQPLTRSLFQAQCANRDVSEQELREQIIEANTNLRERITRTQHLEVQLSNAEHTLAALRFYKPLLHERKNQFQGESQTDQSSAFEMELLTGANFLFSITGIIETTKLRRLLYTFYRISRGNVLSQSDECTFDETKSFFTVWFPTESILRKLMSIAQSYGAEVFEFPAEDPNLDKLENELAQQIFEGTNVLKQSYRDNKTFLLQQQESYWFNQIFFLREKQVYQYLDFADFKTLDDRAIYHGWVPKRRMHEIQPILDAAQEQSGCAVHTTIEYDTVPEAPPTFIETNDFTYAFQLFNDSYGTPSHDEVNGGAFYCMYPFLFGIMFGDVGHSFIYLLVALAIIFGANKIKKSMGDTGEMILAFRWFLLFMAVCGIYCGFIYNEWFGIPIDFFGSKYTPATPEGSNTEFWEKAKGAVYPIGVDPIWMFKDNELTFSNSMKMKLAIVVGFLQMVFGMFLALIKHSHRRHWVEIAVVWIPQFLYMMSFFGYMVFIIILKWNMKEQPNSDGVNLIQTLIGMLLNSGDPIAADATLFPHQKVVQNVIALIFIITIPVLLFAKPIIELTCMKTHTSVMEIFVMNLIDVIEFCLSMLSHTASYLRLWALSLAHSQLSHVLYEQIFMVCLRMKNPAVFFCGWAAYACGTVVILLGMEAFSSLLHAIRLMWVEFSSKFYNGQGYAFQPLSFKDAAKKIGVK